MGSCCQFLILRINLNGNKSKRDAGDTIPNPSNNSYNETLQGESK